MSTVPKQNHPRINRRARVLLEEAPETDYLLSTKQVARWLGLSTQFFEVGRCKGFGPTFIKISPRRVRYRPSDVARWLNENTRQPAGSREDEQDDN